MKIYMRFGSLYLVYLKYSSKYYDLIDRYLYYHFCMGKRKIVK